MLFFMRISIFGVPASPIHNQMGGWNRFHRSRSNWNREECKRWNPKNKCISYFESHGDCYDKPHLVSWWEVGCQNEGEFGFLMSQVRMNELWAFSDNRKQYSLLLLAASGITAIEIKCCKICQILSFWKISLLPNYRRDSEDVYSANDFKSLRKDLWLCFEIAEHRR
jgi:hypothetical protein